MTKPSYASALRMAKQVKLGLASGADNLESHLSAEDRDRLYKAKARKQGKTIVDRANERQYEDYILKTCGLL